MRIKSYVRGRSEDLSFKCLLFSLQNCNSFQNHVNFSINTLKPFKISLFFHSPTPKLTSLTQIVWCDYYIPGSVLRDAGDSTKYVSCLQGACGLVGETDKKIDSPRVLRALSGVCTGGMGYGHSSWDGDNVLESDGGEGLGL